MNLENIKNIAVIGLGRSGIHAAYLAKLLIPNPLNNKIDVLISDSNENVKIGPLERSDIEEYGIKIELGRHSKQNFQLFLYMEKTRSQAMNN